MRKKRICTGKIAAVLMSVILMSTCLPVWAAQPEEQVNSMEQTFQVTKNLDSTEDGTTEKVVVLEIEDHKDDPQITYQWQKKQLAGDGKTPEWQNIAGKTAPRMEVEIPLAGQGEGIYRCMILTGGETVFTEEITVQELTEADMGNILGNDSRNLLGEAEDTEESGPEQEVTEEPEPTELEAEVPGEPEETETDKEKAEDPVDTEAEGEAVEVPNDKETQDSGQEEVKEENTADESIQPENAAAAHPTAVSQPKKAAEVNGMLSQKEEIETVTEKTEPEEQTETEKTENKKITETEADGEENAEKKTENIADINGENDTERDSDTNAVKDTENNAEKDTETSAVEETENNAEKDTETNAAEETENNAEKDTETNAAEETENHTEKDTETDTVKDTENTAEKDSDTDAVKDTESDAEKDSDADKPKDSEQSADEPQDKENGEDTLQQEEQQDQELPPAPEISLRTDTEITVRSLDGYVYSIDGGKNWQTHGYFKDLEPDTAYKIMAGQRKGRSTDSVIRGESVSVRTKKSVPEAPDIPVLLEKTDSKIIVESVEGQEYSMDQGLTWQDSGTFEKLTPETEYNIITRTKETEESVSSPASQSLTVTTEKTPLPIPEKSAAPQLVNRSDTKIEVKAETGQEYSMDGGTVWQDGGSFEGLAPGTDYQIITRVKETEENQAGIASDPLSAATKAAPPEAPPKPELESRSQTVLKIRKKENVEYSMDGGNTWQEEGVFENLQPETGYEIISRVKETEDAMPGKISEALWAETLRMPWIPDPSENSISGIQKDGYYNTGATVNFEAWGAGMDNEGPISGDVRYIPSGWGYRGEMKNWEKAPYKASAVLKYPGRHTIKVRFEKQIYDGSEWKTSGTYYERTLNLTAGRTPRTGDETQAELLALLFILSGVTAAAVFVKRKTERR